MKPYSHCPRCNERHLEERTFEKVVRGGNHTATVTVQALVCRDCGEQLYAPETVRRLEDVRKRLERGETAGFKPIGQAFQAA